MNLKDVKRIIDINYEKDKKILDIVEGKKVAIVGPSPHLLGKNLGSIIDEYDVVCRVNDIPESRFSKDYGSKTDIFFWNCATRLLENFEPHLNKSPRFKNIKHVVCPVIKSASEENVMNFSFGEISPVVENFKSINKRNLDFSWIGVKNYRIFYDLMNRNEPYSGVTAICILLQHQPAELLITGFSFYNQGQGLEESYLPNNCAYDVEVVKRNRIGTHILKPQVDFLKYFILPVYEKLVTIDSYLDQYLNLNYSKIVDKGL